MMRISLRDLVQRLPRFTIPRSEWRLARQMRAGKRCDHRKGIVVVVARSTEARLDDDRARYGRQHRSLGVGAWPRRGEVILCLLCWRLAWQKSRREPWTQTDRDLSAKNRASRRPDLSDRSVVARRNRSYWLRRLNGDENWFVERIRTATITLPHFRSGRSETIEHLTFFRRSESTMRRTLREPGTASCRATPFESRRWNLTACVRSRTKGSFQKERAMQSAKLPLLSAAYHDSDDIVSCKNVLKKFCS